MTALGTLLGGRWLILLDFDGPICSVFSGIPSDVVAQELLGVIGDPPLALIGAQDPFRVLEYAAESRPELAADVERRFTDLETQAVMCADSTPHALEFIREAAELPGIAVAIVSNNSEAAIRTFLAADDYAAYIAGVYARTSADVSLLKPAPHLLTAALNDQRCNEAHAVFVGDSIADIEAGQAAGIPTIAFANKPSKLARLTARRPSAVVTDVSQLRQALRQSVVRSAGKE
ncbi:HAD family hydrolase [Nocardia carnea]|uniref:HAD family hydrolase n=1 Tax=Nocardia carnea TaxID=37328 RepID=A0ABW7TVK3_9NOCA|nr:HAD-IA family hydrolase [Nocardia carnea]